MRRTIFLAVLAGVFWVFPAQAQTRYPDHPADLVSSWYNRYLGRDGSATAINTWADQMRRGVSAEYTLAGIVGSEEFYLRAGSTPEGFVRLMFRDAIGRRPTYRELTYWTDIADRLGRPKAAYRFALRNPDAWQMNEDEDNVAPPPPVRDRYRDRDHYRDRDRDRYHHRDRDRDRYDRR